MLYIMLLSFPPNLRFLVLLPLLLLRLLLMLTRFITYGIALHATSLYVAILRVRGHTSNPWW